MIQELVCKFIKEAMFLRKHPLVDQNKSSHCIIFHYYSNDLFIIIIKEVYIFPFIYTIYEYYNNYVITKCRLSCDVLLMLIGSRRPQG